MDCGNGPQVTSQNNFTCKVHVKDRHGDEGTLALDKDDGSLDKWTLSGV